MLGNIGAIAKSEGYDEMIQAYKALVENYPDCPVVNDASVRLGNLNYARGKLTEAAKYYELFLQKFPEDKRWNNVLYSLAYTYTKMGQLEEAEQLYRAFKEIAGSEDAVPKGLNSWLENPQGEKK